MEKTIEQKIAEGIAQGIQQSKEQEAEKKRKSTIGAFIAIFLSFISVIVLSLIFGASKSLYFMGGSVSSFIFQYIFTKEDFKKRPFVAVMVSLVLGICFIYIM